MADGPDPAISRGRWLTGCGGTSSAAGWSIRWTTCSSRRRPPPIRNCWTRHDGPVRGQRFRPEAAHPRVVGSQAYQRTSRPAGQQKRQRTLQPDADQGPDAGAVVGLAGQPLRAGARDALASSGSVILVLQNGLPTTPRGEFVAAFLGDRNAAPSPTTRRGFRTPCGC